MGALDRLLARDSAAPSLVLPKDEVARVEWPDLWELMTVMRLTDGKARKPSAIKVWLGRGDWSASLADEHTRQSLYVSSGTLLEVFMALQLRIAAPDARWVEWQGGKGRPGQNGRA